MKDYGIGYDRALLLIYRALSRALVLPYVSICGLTVWDSMDNRIQHTFSRMVWQPPLELAISAEASRAATLC